MYLERDRDREREVQGWQKKIIRNKKRDNRICKQCNHVLSDSPCQGAEQDSKP